ncbi:MAG: hypothetical protein KGS72_18120 [Cyanobacteria bacterium REEB67]|nr:hypothetical protein [Cyanobacteria bacterium REEB67]
MFNQPAIDKFVLSLRIRFVVPFVFCCALSLWLFLCQTHYESYWNGTIRKVQTTDFNILHHTMPVTLSALILAGRDDLVQQALDSSYGLFGLVLTDASGDNIVYKTEKSYHNGSWRDRLTREGLAEESEPFDLITDPPQLAPLFVHESPRSLKATVANRPIRSKVLGRLYYVRDVPPSFNSDIANFLFSNMTEISGAKRGYFYISITVLSFATVTLLLIFLRRRGLELKQRELDFVRRELEIRKKALDHLNNELATQKARKVWLEREADQAYKRAIGLKNSLEKLRDALAGAMAQQASQTAAGAQSGLAHFAPGENGNFGVVGFNEQGAPIFNEALSKPSNSHVRIRPVSSPPSTILEEIETLIPDLSENANALRSQADILHDYCNALEERQVEMKRIVETAFVRAQRIGGGAPGNPGNVGYVSDDSVTAGMSAGTGNGAMTSSMNGSDILDMRPS